MKKFILILIASIGISFYLAAQFAGDYRSVGNGNWNDVTKWEMYDGSSWTSAITYPGQKAGTGVVTLTNQTEITITASVPSSISSLVVSGKLIFSSGSPVSLSVSDDVIIYGTMSVTDQNGEKSHSLAIGGSLVAGTWAYDEELQWCDYACLFSYCYYPLGGYIQTISNDDMLEVIFNTTKPNSLIGGARTITFQDISFNGIGISVGTSIYINGTARFVNGLVKSGNGYAVGLGDTTYCGDFWSPSDYVPPPPSSCCGVVFFNDGATASGASINSFVNGVVAKQGNDQFTFPIGYKDEGASVPLTIYAPLTISAPLGAQDVFSAMYSRGQQTWDISDTGLRNVSNCEYWDLHAGYQTHNDNLTSSIDVTAGWSSSSGCGSPYVTNVPEVTLAHFNGHSWDSHGGSGEGTTTNGSVTWRSAPTLGDFTFGNVNTSCITPSALSATNITTNSATLNWSAVAGSMSYNIYLKPATSCCWEIAVTGITLPSFIVSGLTPLVTYDWEVSANCGSSLSAYKLGPQFTTQNPCGTPSGLTATNLTTSAATLSWNAVSNAINYNLQYKQSTSSNWITAAVGTTSLSYMLSGLTASTMYDWRISAACNEGTGLYAQANFTTSPLPPSPICNDVYEPNNTPGQAKTITLGLTISGSISSTSDVDWFKMTMPNNSNTTLQVILNNLPADYDLYVYNKNLDLVASSANTGTSNELVTYSSRTRNTSYYIKVVGKNGAYNASQCYNLSALAIGSSVLLTSAIPDRTNEITDASNNQVLYPNPASEFVYLNFNSATEGLVNIQIVNSIGQLVKQLPVNTIKGHNQIKIQVVDIRQGMYIIKINKGDVNLIRKFVIAR